MLGIDFVLQPGTLPGMDDHSASRRLDVLQHEAPHLIAADPDDTYRRVTVDVGDTLVIHGVRYRLAYNGRSYVLVPEMPDAV